MPKLEAPQGTARTMVEVDLDLAQEMYKAIQERRETKRAFLERAIRAELAKKGEGE